MTEGRPMGAYALALGRGGFIETPPGAVRRQPGGMPPALDLELHHGEVKKGTLGWRLI